VGHAAKGGRADACLHLKRESLTSVRQGRVEKLDRFFFPPLINRSGAGASVKREFVGADGDVLADQFADIALLFTWRRACLKIDFETARFLPGGVIPAPARSPVVHLG
jgi:hypothetical protein